jgi:hypothetical protein
MFLCQTTIKSNTVRNITKLFSILFVGVMMVNCGGDDGSNAPTVIPAFITTVSATDVTGLEVTLNGKVTQGSSPIQNFGFCVSSDPNPTTNDYKYYAEGSPGEYALTITSRKPNSTFHVRAFAVTLGGVYYGQDLTYTSGFPVNSILPTNILPKSARFRGSVPSLPDNSVGNVSIGYCFHTSPNPTVSNENFAIGGAGPFEHDVNFLQPNTTYYARPYCYIGADLYYGAEVSFKTTGYFGPAGGYVVYDKGDTVEGWRYLEVYPQTLSYDISWSTGATWGCNTTLLSNTYPNIGAGYGNTQNIVANCSSANCAARLCDNYVKNGYTDWFLGSRDEMMAAGKALFSINVTVIGDCWTSSELVNNQAYSIYYSTSSSTYLSSSQSKGTYDGVFPMRRY